jgi:hypothetical protein
VKRRLALALAVACAALSLGSPARADAPRASAGCPELPCSVIRNCSSTGVACRPDDRACAEEARGKDLEVKCEQPCDDGPRLVYCPPDTGRSDSKVVWLLLTMAITVAIGGSAILWVVLRKKSA